MLDVGKVGVFLGVFRVVRHARLVESRLVYSYVGAVAPHKDRKIAVSARALCPVVGNAETLVYHLLYAVCYVRGFILAAVLCVPPAERYELGPVLIAGIV